jgi:hypothetical protein
MGVQWERPETVSAGKGFAAPRKAHPDDGTPGRPEVLRGDLRRILLDSLPCSVPGKITCHLIAATLERRYGPLRRPRLNGAGGCVSSSGSQVHAPTASIAASVACDRQPGSHVSICLLTC